MCYALGLIDMFDGIYDISSIRMAIYQPRRDNVSTYEMSKEELLTWANNTLSPIASLAMKGKGEFKAGNHCKFCKIKATCRKRAEYNLQMAKYDFQMPNTLEDHEIDAILMDIDQFISWANDIKEYALKEALNGKEYEHFKVVEGRSNRKYKNEDEVAKVVTDAGYDPYDMKLKGITAMTKLLGKSEFESLLGDLTYKPDGKPTLVPKSDKRPSMKTSAKTDFN